MLLNAVSLMLALVATATPDYDIRVSLLPLPKSPCEFILRVEIRDHGGLSAPASTMHLTPGSFARGESKAGSRDGVVMRCLTNAKVNSEGTEASYEIRLLQNKKVVASRSAVVDLTPLARGD